MSDDTRETLDGEYLENVEWMARVWTERQRVAAIRILRESLNREAADQLAAPVGEQEKEQSVDSACGWVIEAAGPKYWTGKGNNDFTDDPDLACRFARFVDAEVVRCYALPDLIRVLTVSREHAWSGRTP